jgi:hypothetical protein
MAAVVCWGTITICHVWSIGDSDINTTCYTITSLCRYQRTTCKKENHGKLHFCERANRKIEFFNQSELLEENVTFY